MEIIIISCLILIILLLLSDKFKILIHVPREIKQKKNKKASSIMGEPKILEPLKKLNTSINFPIEAKEIDTSKLEIEYDKNETLYPTKPHQKKEEYLTHTPDFMEEEEEWTTYENNKEEIGLAQGVTFEELMVVGDILKKEKVEQVQQQKLTSIIDKLYGTELYHLLENSMQDNAQKITSLLENNLSVKPKAPSAPLQKKDITDFNIDEFI